MTDDDDAVPDGPSGLDLPDLPGGPSGLVPAVAGPVGFVSVRAGEVGGLMRAYRAAVGSARDVEAVLLDAGVGEDLLGVWPGVDDAGCPVVVVVVTVAGAHRLARLPGTGRGPPPPTTSAA